MKKQMNEIDLRKERMNELKKLRFLTIKEKKELLLAGEDIPLCVGSGKPPKKAIVKYYSIYNKKRIKI